MKVKDVKHKVTLDDFEHRLIVGCVNVARTRINTAVNDLYGGWDDFSEDSKPFIEDALKTADLEAVYTSVKYRGYPEITERKAKEITFKWVAHGSPFVMSEIINVSRMCTFRRTD